MFNSLSLSLSLSLAFCHSTLVHSTFGIALVPMMPRGTLQPWLLFSLLCIASSAYSFTMERPELLASNAYVKSETFRSPPFILGPGEVQNNYYYEIPFPKGHIAIKGFDAEVVDEDGNSIPLNEVYLHHWLLINYYSKQGHGNSIVIEGNDGLCGRGLSQIFGLGSETRHTSTAVPDPYGIEMGNPKVIPDGDKEAWLLNVHAIDTRGTIDPLGCTECRCDLYNVTRKEGYIGGLYCCHDKTQCRLKDSFEGPKRTLYLQYTVQWMDWDESIVPVKVYIFDATYDGTKCKIEYNVPSCNMSNHGADCVDSRETSISMPVSGEIVFAAAHQHTGGIGISLYAEDGREICTSLPIYGEGEEAGNEAGYIVGMSTCYLKPGSVRVGNGEKLRLVSRYSRVRAHTGVMGLSYILIDERPQLTTTLESLVQKFKQETEVGFLNIGTALPIILSGMAVLILLTLIAFAIVKKNKNDVYEILAA